MCYNVDNKQEKGEKDMTLEHYLEQEQLTEESSEQIINICAKHNMYLNDFLKT